MNIDVLQDRLFKADASGFTRDYWFAVMDTYDGFDELDAPVRHAITDVVYFADFSNPQICTAFDYYIKQIAKGAHPVCMEVGRGDP